MSIEENSSTATSEPQGSSENGSGTVGVGPEPEQAQEGSEVLGSHVCDTCTGDNLLKSIGILKCAKCRNPFCIHFASKYDPAHFCVSCGSEIELSSSIVTKEYKHERYDEETDTISTTMYTRRAKEYKLAGETWMFNQRRVRDLTDAELDIAIEFHRQYLQLLCADQDRRRAEKAHRNAGVKFQMPSGITSTTSTVVETKKTTVVKTDKAKAQAAAAFSVLLAQGMTMEDIMKALGGIK